MFRATKIMRYITAMAQQGIDAEALLAATKIDAHLVANPDYLISLEQYYAVVENMIRLTGNPGIAFTLGKTAKLNDFGIVGYAMISSSTLSQATDIWIKYANSLVGSPLLISWTNIDEGHAVTFASRSGIGALRRFEIEEAIVQGINVVRDLTGIAPVFGTMSLSYPEPPYRSLYEERFQCPLEFDADKTVVRILKPDFGAPVRTMNEELFSICAEHCQQVMSLLPNAGQLRNRLRNLFLSTPGKLPTLEETSTELGMSVSTLSRHLDELGESYQSIKDGFRYDLAREYLRSGHMTPKQVGYLLGFTSPSNFSRAFKAWSGQTVGQFLDTNRQSQ